MRPVATTVLEIVTPIHKRERVDCERESERDIRAGRETQDALTKGDRLELYPMAGQRPTLSIREVARAGTSRNRAQVRSWPGCWESHVEPATQRLKQRLIDYVRKLKTLRIQSNSAFFSSISML